LTFKSFHPQRKALLDPRRLRVPQQRFVVVIFSFLFVLFFFSFSLFAFMQLLQFSFMPFLLLFLYAVNQADRLSIYNVERFISRPAHANLRSSPASWN
jgi:hypothetical protein